MVQYRVWNFTPGIKHLSHELTLKWNDIGAIPTRIITSEENRLPRLAQAM